MRFYAFYGITSNHPIDFHFGRSSLAGSYFLSRCHVNSSILHKTDVRGDELKRRGQVFHLGGREILMHQDECIRVQHSFLVKTLVHSYNHDPEFPEFYSIVNTFAAPYANIHGSAIRGCLLGPFATLDLTTVHDCMIGPFAYVQTGQISHTAVEPGSVWIEHGSDFRFHYQFPKDALQEYVRYDAKRGVQGRLVAFIRQRKRHFQEIFDVVHFNRSDNTHRSTALNRYAVVRGGTRISENVLVAQRAYLENADLGKGANAQENCYIVDSCLQGFNVMAHGAKIIHARLGEKGFVGFNAFLRGSPQAPLDIGHHSIVMPHTIIDTETALQIPPEHLVWGLIRNPQELAENSISLEKLSQHNQGFRQGRLVFDGSGKTFVEQFQKRIEHILLDNGAYFDGRQKRGHAQQGQNIAFNIIQPYTTGPRRGLFPTMNIHEGTG
jgi:carbonic anhydrase/acetyltransferase-like protein (isoleucine patch superfamily)